MNWHEHYEYRDGVLYHKVKPCRRHDVNVGMLLEGLPKTAITMLFTRTGRIRDLELYGRCLMVRYQMVLL